MKKNKIPSEKRIYVVVAETVSTPEGEVVQVPGRIAAQAVHVASRMKMHQIIGLSEKHQLARADEAITTIILGARDSNELRHVQRLLEKAEIEHYTFEDINPAVYGEDCGAPCEVTTALATVPVMPEEVVDILDYLPLWAPRS